MIRCKAVIVLLAARITEDLRSLGYTVADPGPRLRRGRAAVLRPFPAAILGRSRGKTRHLARGGASPWRRRKPSSDRPECTGVLGDIGRCAERRSGSPGAWGLSPPQLHRILPPCHGEDTLP